MGKKIQKFIKTIEKQECQSMEERLENIRTTLLLNIWIKILFKVKIIYICNSSLANLNI